MKVPNENAVSRSQSVDQHLDESLLSCKPRTVAPPPEILLEYLEYAEPRGIRAGISLYLSGREARKQSAGSRRRELVRATAFDRCLGLASRYLRRSPRSE